MPGSGSMPANLEFMCCKFHEILALLVGLRIGRLIEFSGTLEPIGSWIAGH
jgi:hypothetical protein